MCAKVTQSQNKPVGYKGDIAIIGIGCRFPDADNYIEFWHNLRDGKNSIKDIIQREVDTPEGKKIMGRWSEKFYSPDFNKPNTSISRWCGLIDRIDLFDNKFFNISPREAKNIDPQQRLLLEETWHCIEDSGVPLRRLQDKKTSVYIGVMAADYHQEASNEDVIIESYAGLGNYDCILANRISYFFGFNGVSMAVDAACASSLVAIHEGRYSLINRESDYVIAGGVALNIHPWKYISFSKSRMLSGDGQCKTFDKDANGYVPGEGIAVVLMQRLEDAVAAGNHIYGVVKGSSVNHGGATRSITAPRVEAQQELILKAYQEAGFRPHTVSYMEAHGTGTSLGDPIEVEALKKAFYEFLPREISFPEFEKKILGYITSDDDKAFLHDVYHKDNRKRRYALKYDLPDETIQRLRDILKSIRYVTTDKQFCKIGSAKTNIGHLEASAGVAGVIKVLMMMKYRQIPPTLNLATLNPIINWKQTPFILAGFDKRITDFANKIKAEFKIKKILPTIFNEKSTAGLAVALYDNYRNELEQHPTFKNFTREEAIELLQKDLTRIAAEVFFIDIDKVTPNMELYKKVETWHCPEIYKLVKIFSDKFKIFDLDPEAIIQSSIDEVVVFIVSSEREALEEYYEKTFDNYEELVSVFKNELIELIAVVYRMDKSEIDTRKNLRDYQSIPLRAGISSFGFGGVNSHVLLEEFSQRYNEKDVRNFFNLFMISAKSEKSFYGIVGKWKRYYTSEAFAKYTLKDICSNLMVGREQFQYRCGFKITGKGKLIPYLKDVEPVKVKTGESSWVLRIGNYTWSGYTEIEQASKQMCIFKDTIDRIEDIFDEFKFTKAIKDGFKAKKWSGKYLSLYSFIASYAYIECLIGLGFKPNVIIAEKEGIMLGLVISGMVDVADAMQIIAGKKTFQDILFTRPRIPYFDYYLKETLMPFHFDKKYLTDLVKEVAEKNNQLGDLLIDGFIQTEKGRPETRLGAVLIRNEIITEEELDKFLKIQEKTGKKLGDIVMKHKKDLDNEDLQSCLQEQELLHYYIDDVIHLDKASILSETQFTFKKYLEEWDAILESRGKNISQILKDKELLKDLKGRNTNEKTLLMVIIMSSLRRLNQKWDLTDQKAEEELRFYELIDLVVDGVMLKEDVIELFMDENPDYKRIIDTLNTRQKFGNVKKSYTYIRDTNKNILEVMEAGGPALWYEQELKTEPVFPIDKNGKPVDLAYLPQDQYSYFNFGKIHQPSEYHSMTHALPGEKLVESIKDSLLDLWLTGINMDWAKLIKEGEYNKLALPMYIFYGNSYWLPKQSGASGQMVVDSKKGGLGSDVVARTYVQNDPLVKAHNILGLTIIPGAGMIEFGLDSVRRNSNTVKKLTDISIPNPGVVSESLDVNVVVSPGEKKFNVVQENTVLCSGNYSDQTITSVTKIDFSGLSNVQPLSTDGMYNTFSTLGYNYGTDLQVIKNIWLINDNYIFELQENQQSEGQNTGLSPFLLDGAFQSALYIEHLEGRYNSDNVILVPYFIQQLLLINTVKEKCFVVINKAHMSRKGSDLNVDFKMYNARGDEVLDITGMILKAAPTTFLDKYKSATVQKDITYCYQPVWNVKNVVKTHALKNKNAIVFDNGDSLTDFFMKNFSSLYNSVDLVKKGKKSGKKDAHEWKVKFADEEGYKDLLKQLLVDTPDTIDGIDIYFLHAYQTSKHESINDKVLANYEEHGIKSLFLLSKALMLAGLKKNVTIYVPTNDALVAGNNDTGSGFAYSGVTGLANTVMKESTKIKITVVDFESTAENKIVTTALSDEAQHMQQGQIVAYRAGTRYVKDFQRVEFGSAPSLFKQNGVYVIVGGAGGIGLKITEMITSKVGANIVLTGRSPANADRQAGIDALNTDNSRVVYLHGDITKQKDVNAIVSSVKKQFGKIDGIIQAGGILEDKVIVSKEWESFKRVGLPKITGTWYLHEATKDEKLDFFVVFSSIVSVMGNPGQVDYATANAFLDGFMHYRRQQGAPGKSISVNWTLWADGGMGLSDNIVKAFEKKGGVIYSQGGVKAFDDIVSSDITQCVVAGNTGYFDDLASRKTLPVSSDNKNEVIEDIDLENFVINLIAGKLDMSEDDVNGDDSFFSMGVESVILQDITAELDRKFENLPATALFEYPNVNQLVEFLKTKPIKQGAFLSRTSPGVDSQIKAETVQKEITEVDLEEFVINLIAGKLDMQPDDVNIDDSFFSMGVESVILQDITAELDRKFENLPATALFEYPNVNQLVEFLKTKPIKEGAFVITQASSEGAQTSAGVVQEQSITITDSSKQTVSHVDLFSSNIHREPAATGPGELYSPDNNSYEIAIIGMSGQLPQAPNIEQFWENLLQGKDCIEEIPKERWDNDLYFNPDVKHRDTTYAKWGGFINDVDRFDSLFFNISPIEAAQMDPQQRLFLQNVWETMEYAGYGNKKQYKDNRIGLYVGTMWNDYSKVTNEEGFAKNRYLGPGSYYWGIANRISYTMDFKGPCIALDTACSSSLVAVHLACRGILNNECDMAIAGGVNLTIHPSKYIYLSQAKFLSTDGRCRSFGEGGSGYVPGEGVASILLKPLKKAMQDGDSIYGIIRGSSTNHGGKATGFTVPNPEAQANLIIDAIKSAKISADQINYLESHGTGTSLGDPIEIAGLTRAFTQFTDKKQFCPIGSVKSNIGHLEAASGVAAIIKVLLAMENNKIPKSLHSENKNPNINFSETPFYVVNDTLDWLPSISNPRMSGISSFGAGGSNAHVIIEAFDRYNDEYNARFINSGRDELSLIPFSAESNEQLLEIIRKVNRYLEKNKNNDLISFNDIVCTLQMGREKYKQRAAVLANSKQDLIDKLTSILNNTIDLKSVFMGHVKEKKKLEKEKQSRSYINSLLNENKTAEIAAIWSKGVDLDWGKIVAGKTYKKVSLPTYPFAKVKFWITKFAGDENKNILPNTTLVKGNKLHPLISENKSTMHESRFSTIFTGNEFFLKDHKVNNQKVLPGVAYLEMARKATEIAAEQNIVKLKGIVWQQVFSIDNKPDEMHVVLNKKQNDIAFKMISWKGTTEVIHSQGKIVQEKNTGGENSINIEQIKQRCNKIRSQAECYSIFNSKGLNYGPDFQGIKELVYNDKEGLARIELPKDRMSDFNDYTIHPSITDSALQAVIGQMHDQIESDVTYLPFSLGEIELLKPLTGTCYSYVTRIGAPDSKVKKFDIFIVDENGVILSKLRNFALNSVKTGKKMEKTNVLNDEAALEVLNKLRNGLIDISEADSLLGGYNG